MAKKQSQPFYKSRTIITLLILIGFSAVQVYENVLPAEQYALVVSILSTLAAYFRVNAVVSLKK